MNHWWNTFINGGEETNPSLLWKRRIPNKLYVYSTLTEMEHKSQSVSVMCAQLPSKEDGLERGIKEQLYSKEITSTASTR